MSIQGSIVPPGWTLKQAQKHLVKENQKWPDRLTLVPCEQWPAALRDKDGAMVAVWRSRRYCVQVHEKEGQTRLTAHRTTLGPDGRWEDGITWDALQRLKREAGFGDRWAVEIYPDDSAVVNVANMRHLWLLPGAPDYAWVPT